MSAELKGAPELLEELTKLMLRHEGAVARALYAEGLSIQRDAVKRCPVEYAVLRNSAYTAPPTKGSGDTYVETGFGTDYAVPVHEVLEAKHPKGEAKFLQRAIEARWNDILPSIAKRAAHNMLTGKTTPTVTAVGQTEPAMHPPKGSGHKKKRAKKRKKSKLTAKRQKRTAKAKPDAST